MAFPEEETRRAKGIRKWSGCGYVGDQCEYNEACDEQDEGEDAGHR